MAAFVPARHAPGAARRLSMKNVRSVECEEVRPRLDAYLDGEVAEAERALLHQHLAGCAKCGPEAAALERLRDGIRQAAPVYRAPEGLRRQLRSALRRELRLARRPRCTRQVSSRIPPRF